MASKSSILKQVSNIQWSMTKLWHQIDEDNDLHCQTITKELAELQRKIENGTIKPKQ